MLVFLPLRPGKARKITTKGIWRYLSILVSRVISILSSTLCTCSASIVLYYLIVSTATNAGSQFVLLFLTQATRGSNSLLEMCDVKYKNNLTKKADIKSLMWVFFSHKFILWLYCLSRGRMGELVQQAGGKVGGNYGNLILLSLFRLWTSSDHARMLISFDYNFREEYTF